MKLIVTLTHVLAKTRHVTLPTFTTLQWTPAEQNNPQLKPLNGKPYTASNTIVKLSTQKKKAIRIALPPPPPSERAQSLDPTIYSI